MRRCFGIKRRSRQGITRVDAAWRARESFQLWQLHDALYAAGPRPSRRLHRHIRACRLRPAHAVNPRHGRSRKLVFIGDNCRTESGAGRPPTDNAVDTAITLTRNVPAEMICWAAAARKNTRGDIVARNDQTITGSAIAGNVPQRFGRRTSNVPELRDRPLLTPCKGQRHLLAPPWWVPCSQ
jgi:hypothetical protein